MTIDGTGLVNEPIVAVTNYGHNQYVPKESDWGAFLTVEFEDGSELQVFANEVFITVTD